MTGLLEDYESAHRLKGGKVLPRVEAQYRTGPPEAYASLPGLLQASFRDIPEIEKELRVIRDIDEANQDAVSSSERPLVDAVFAASSNKRRKLLERELMGAKSERAHELLEEQIRAMHGD